VPSVEIFDSQLMLDRQETVYVDIRDGLAIIQPEHCNRLFVTSVQRLPQKPLEPSPSLSCLHSADRRTSHSSHFTCTVTAT
jgi:hypothetical protein